MPLILIVALALAQMSPAQLAQLREYRDGRTSAQIEAMGWDAFQKEFDAKHPPSGVTRGVAFGVYTDAYRENTGRRYRAVAPPNVQSRRLAIDKQLRFIGVLFARNEWRIAGGGNAFDPESDVLDYAQAERRLYVGGGQPDEARMRRRLADYRKEIRSKGIPELETNLRKIDGAILKAKTLCTTAGERAVLFGFVAEQAKATL